MQKSYYAVIPAIVRYDRELTGNAKLLYGEITALCNEKGYCWATNQYFADLYDVSKKTITQWIKQLEKRKYVETKLNYKENSKEVANRFIFLLPFPVDGKFYDTVQNSTYPGEENFPTSPQKGKYPGEEKVRENNTFNNTKEYSMSSSEKIPFKKIIEHLNKVAESRFSPKSSDTQKNIKARWNEGNTFEDFISVIDIKTKQWKDNPEMSKYLRPSTLFSAKNFENYKGEAIAESKKQKQNRKQNTSDFEQLEGMFGDSA